MQKLHSYDADIPARISRLKSPNDDGIVVVEVGHRGVVMRRASVPKALYDSLGDHGAEALIRVMNEHEDLLADRIARTVVQQLDPRLSGIEARLGRVEARLDHCATKEDLSKVRVEMAEGFGLVRSDMAAQRTDTIKWMFVFWVGQAFVVLAYFRAGQYLAGS